MANPHIPANSLTSWHIKAQQLLGGNPKKSMPWRQAAASAAATNGCQTCVGLGVLRPQFSVLKTQDSHLRTQTSNFPGFSKFFFGKAKANTWRLCASFIKSQQSATSCKRLAKVGGFGRRDTV